MIPDKYFKLIFDILELQLDDYIGGGAHGEAYKCFDKTNTPCVVKFTNEHDEISFAQQISNRNTNHIVKIHRIVKFTGDEFKQGFIYCIVQEYLYPIPKNIKQIKLTNDDVYYEFDDIFELIMTQDTLLDDLEDMPENQKVVDSKQYKYLIRQINALVVELQKYVKRYAKDIHIGNIMYSIDGNIKLIDQWSHEYVSDIETLGL